ncbi:hypothetical protein [Agrobacterium tumefaciens]|uniref:hypothetical protein n=1 Tax=Agrobacterium tumefaciens TaxID=358 RepID=UPI002865BBC5|nr:hypothetical protein [Agrobacterium tumefaciens]MDR6587396.1 hypothetical protein [Agrobacterium tumefaciens]
MADKSADIQTLAPRLSYVEDLAAWLKDNRGEGGGGTTDQKLWRATLTGAETSSSWSEEPWTQTDLIYGPNSPNGLSLHQTIFGSSFADAMKMHDGKGFYAWIFPSDETRWQNGPSQSGAHLANEVFGLPDSGYVHALRSASMSLMSSVFKSVEYVGDYTIIDRILDIAEELESLATNVEQALSDFQNEMQSGFDSINTQIDALRFENVSIRARLTAGGL